jgi:NADH:ubiquinone oxidoreductase subunit K
MHRSRPDFKAYFGALANYVNGEFINCANRHRYPDGPIRRSYMMIPLQKSISLALVLLNAPLQVIAVTRGRKRVDRAAILFPLLLIASKCQALGLALKAQLQRMVRQ